MRSIIDDKAIENIVLEHILKVRQLEVDTCKVLKERIENLVSRLLLRINQNLKNMDYIKSYDRLYYHVEDMKLEYEEFLKTFDERIQYIEENDVNDLFIGIRAMVLKFINTVPVKNDNPITYERMVLISAAILRVKQYWMTQLDEGLKTCKLDNNISEDGLEIFMNREVRNFFFHGMFTTNQMLEESIELLSHFEEGKRYVTFTKEQVKELSTLVMRQKDVVRSQLKTAREIEVVNSWMDHLTYIYKQSVEILEELDDQPISLSNAAEVIHMEQLEGLLDAQVFSDQAQMNTLYKRATEINDESVAELRSILESKVDYLHTEMTQKAKRDGESYKLLSGQLTNVFREVVQLLSQLEDSYTSEDGGIIAEGIAHTMSLKLESIEEMGKDYALGKDKLLLTLDQSIDEKKEKILENTDLILEDIIENSSTALMRRQKQFLDALDVVKDKNFKFDMAFLKNDLLFELRTFEELIEYSLKKLIELEPDRASEMTKIMIGAMEKSREILSNHEVELIIPKAHDKFEPKAHEAIIAEALEGFSKGEVIKTINIGYRKREHIIIRASVMAAR